MISTLIARGWSSFELAILLLSLIVGGAFSYVLVVIIYRLTFHPLAKYPGPFLAKITDLHQTYHAYIGDRHLEFWRMHEKYGKFVRFGPDSLSINSNTALKEIYGFKANVRKAEFYAAFPPTKDTFNTHSSIDKTAHSRKRRVLSHAFSDSAIKTMERYILANIRSFVSGLANVPATDDEKGWSMGQNMADWCNYLTFDVMGDLCFGKAFGMLEKPDNRFAIDLIGSAAHRHLICGTMPILHEYHLDTVLFPKLAAGRARYMAYSKSQALERTKLGQDSSRRDFFHYLLNAKDPETGKGFSTAELWGESNLLIIAGSDTSSTALAAAFFYLVHNPRTLQKLQTEVRAAFTDVEDIISGPALQGCTYLRAVLDEAMRMAPPVGGLLPREVLVGGIDIDGVHVPAGTVVGTPHYTIHHHPGYYPDPFSFVPERWIVGADTLSLGSGGSGGALISTTDEAVQRAQSAFCPFSIGPRGCIGKGMAYVELSVALARVVFALDMRLMEEVEEDTKGVKRGEGGYVDAEWGRHRRGEYQLKDSFTSIKDGPMIQFRRREK